MDPSRPPTTPIPARRRWAFRVVTALLSTVVVGAAIRTCNEIRTRSVATHGPQRSEDEPAIPETLRLECHVVGEECEELYGVELAMCHRPACRGELGFTTTPQGLVGPTNRSYAEAKPPGTYRILALGGSTTGGKPWSENWPAQLERLLRDRARTMGREVDFEVLNLAMAGGGSRTSLMLYQGIGRRFEVDMLILGEEVNDFGGCASFEHTAAPSEDRSQLAVVEAFFEGRAEPGELAELSEWFGRHVDAFVEERRRRPLERGAAGLRDALGLERDARRGLDGEELRRRCRAPKPLDVASPSIHDDYVDGWSYTRHFYDEIVATARRAGVKQVVLSTVPQDFEDWRCPTPTCPPVFELRDWARYIRELHNPELERYAREIGALVVDLESGVDAFARGEAPAGASPSWILSDHALSTGLEPDDLERELRSGAIGKAPLFQLEWMHPSSDGHRLIAAIYAEALAPVVFP